MSTHIDELSREAYCVLGVPIDVIEMSSVLRDIEAAAASRSPLFISTPNLNFLVKSQANPDFRGSLLQSDLCPADGILVVWIARALGIPIKGRIAGSDIFVALKAGHGAGKPLKVFLFGGADGVAAAACQALNAQPSGLVCVGSYYPGLGSVDDMSHDYVIDEINSSEADLLVVSLGAEKGQTWLQRNHRRLRIPVRAHLGAVINFEAAVIKRAPHVMRRLGLEWLWQIKEERHLWKRYWSDGNALIHLLFTSILPLALRHWRALECDEDLVITEAHDYDAVTLSLGGAATARYLDKIIPALRSATATGKSIVIDFSHTRTVDARFLGLLLMLSKTQKGSGATAIFTGLSPELKNLFRLNGVGFLLSE